MKFKTIERYKLANYTNYHLSIYLRSRQVNNEFIFTQLTRFPVTYHLRKIMFQRQMFTFVTKGAAEVFLNKSLGKKPTFLVHKNTFEELHG